MKKIKNIIDNNALKELLQIEQADREAVEAISFQMLPWLNSIKKLPNNIKIALLKELQLGNYVTQIQDLDWPQKGSVIILLQYPFKDKNPSEIEGISFRKMNDPHYWMEDIHTIVDGIEYLIIT